LRRRWERLGGWLGGIDKERGRRGDAETRRRGDAEIGMGSLLVDGRFVAWESYLGIALTPTLSRRERG
jgi:hypothetical protein